MFFKKTEKKLSFENLSEAGKTDLNLTLEKIYSIIAQVRDILEELDQTLSEQLNKIQFSYFRQLYLQVNSLSEDLIYLISIKENNIRWLEKISLRKGHYIDLISTPVYVGDYLSQKIFEHQHSIIFTSATIAVQGNFNYFLSRMGYLDNNLKIGSLLLGSPFDVERNTLLCVPSDTPAYHDTKEYLDTMGTYLIDTIKAVNGRALVLFTSHKHLTETYYQLREPLQKQGINLYCQGKKMSEKNLIKSFKDDTRSVLMGTSSFWEGIDVPGESLSTVIIVKLPFEVPTDPIVVARMEQVARQGQSSFFHYLIPNAIVRIKQGVGRLIRNNQDKGAIIILDNRVLTKGYGQAFVKSLQATRVFPENKEEMRDDLHQWFSHV